LAFPDGCSSAANYVYPGLCANGEVDVYDYRSEGEERGVAGWDVRLTGNVSALGTTHRLALGLGGHESHADLAPLQAYNFVGTTNIDAPVALPSDSSLTVLNTNSHDKALDVYVSLTSALGSNMQAFVGMRASRLERSSARSDGTEAVALGQTVSTPWAGLAWTPAASTLMYASWGQGAEMESVPNRPDLFVNYGEALPALKSEQSEVGLKWQANARLLLTAAAFNISKPLADDVVNADGPALRMAGRKTARHRGLEFGASGRVDEQLSIHASATVLDAVYTQAQDTSLAGRAVTNIPRVKASVFADYKLVAAPGLAMNALWTYEHGKTVTADGSVTLPDAWQLDAGVRYQQKMAGKATQWRLNVENLTDRNYWREAPTQYWGGIYLFPSTPRTLRASVTVDF
jgi:iron complex outermembrane receptor protein